MKHNFPDKIIFLDIDGVINIPPYTMFNEQCMNILREIIKQTNAKIVISSSWRCDNILMKEQFDEHCFPEDLWNEIIDITIRGYQYVIKGSKLPIVRGNEIKAWVDTHLKYPWHATPSLDKQYQLLNEDGSFKIMNTNHLNIDYSYLILDDDTDMLYDQRNNFINTNGLLGLEEKHIEQAVKILNY